MWRWVAVLVLAIGVSLSLASAGWASEPASDAGAQDALEGEIWQPQPGLTWQWQLSGRVDTSVDVDVYNVDMFDNDAAVVQELHDRGSKVICYISAGSWENWRSDAGAFPNSVKGRNNGWPGERWLDIRRLDVLGPIMEDRLDECRSKGFDGVEFDNIDGYENRTGFPLSWDDQIAYNRYLAQAAHDRGLAAGFKNDVQQASVLEESFDFAVNEECFKYRECGKLGVFIDAGKAVFHVEYDLARSKFCSKARQLGFSSMRKHLDLGAWRRPC